MAELRPIRYNGPAYRHQCGHLSAGGGDNCPICNQLQQERERVEKLGKALQRIYDGENPSPGDGLDAIEDINERLACHFYAIAKTALKELEATDA